MHFCFSSATMQIYYPNLPAIQQQTLQLDHVQCHHCNQTDQLISHGFIYKKQHCAEPKAVGKRVFCSNRHKRTGCGRTVQLYLDSIVRYLHYTGACVVAFLLSFVNGMTIAQAYRQATGKDDSRNAYRWLHKFAAQLCHYRSLFHQPTLQDGESIIGPASPRKDLFASTLRMLLRRFDHPLCAQYQYQLQRSFL